MLFWEVYENIITFSFIGFNCYEKNLEYWIRKKVGKGAQ